MEKLRGQYNKTVIRNKLQIFLVGKPWREETTWEILSYREDNVKTGTKYIW
jgi:hypothetical protein